MCALCIRYMTPLAGSVSTCFCRPSAPPRWAFPTPFTAMLTVCFLLHSTVPKHRQSRWVKLSPHLHQHRFLLPVRSCPKLNRFTNSWLARLTRLLCSFTSFTYVTIDIAATYLVYFTSNGAQTSRYETFSASTPVPTTTIQPSAGTVLDYSSYLPPSSSSSCRSSSSYRMILSHGVEKLTSFCM